MKGKGIMQVVRMNGARRHAMRRRGGRRFHILALAVAMTVGIALPVHATTYTIPVLPAGDAVFLHAHWSGGGMNVWYPDASPNSASYSYNCCPADVQYTHSVLEFNIGSIPSRRNRDLGYTRAV